MNTIMSNATLSLRIPEDIKVGLEQIAQKTERSRNYHSIVALRQYLKEFEQTPRSVAEVALSYSGAGLKSGAQSKSIAEIDHLIRDLRNDG